MSIPKIPFSGSPACARLSGRVERAGDPLGNNTGQEVAAKAASAQVEQSTLRMRIPREMQDRAQWVLWQYQQRDGKVTKVPMTVSGQLARTNDSSTWVSFEAVIEAFASGQGDGVGFVFTATDDFVGIDLDACRDPSSGRLAPQAAALIERVMQFGGAYAEVSPSGTGLHLIVRGRLPAGGRKKAGIEIYDCGRFFTITGDTLDSACFEPGHAQKFIDWLLATHFNDGERSKGGGSGAKVRAALPLEPPMAMAEQRVQALFEDWPQLEATWARQRVFNDDSLSSYDLSLAAQAFISGLDTTQAWSLIIAFREKHGESAKAYRRDYIARTLAKAGYGSQIDLHPAAAPVGDWAEHSTADAVVLDRSDPLRSAQCFLEKGRVMGRRTVHYWQGDFYRWDGACYRQLPLDEIRAELYCFCDGAVTIGSQGKLERFKPNKNRVANILEALAGEAQLQGIQAVPCWLQANRALPPEEVMVVENGLVHVPTGQLHAPDPEFFATSALPVAYGPGAPPPHRWLRFLESLWPGEPEAIAILQEIFGYLLLPDMQLQKLFLLIGPKRSGKGTIARVLTAVLGRDHVAGPTLSSLAANFGLESLIGKPCAVISDARLSGRADQSVVVERFLTISGEDVITIDRKYRSAWTGQLRTRFVLLTNELPRLTDASGALASRFITLVMRQSFYGREDHGLTASLLEELPGILNWALEGRRRLQARGHFIQPASSSEVTVELEALSSPISSFLHERCVVRPGACVKVSELYDAWCDWCDEHGRNHPGTTATFGRDLRAVVPELKVTQPRGSEPRVRHYEGIGLQV